MTSDWTIRAGRRDDGAAMRDVHVASIMAVDHALYPEAILRSWAHGLRPEGYGASMDDGEEFEVAIDAAARLIAFCGVKNGEVFGLYVHPAAQQAGLGTTLLERGEARARAQRPNADHLPLSAALNAVPFYQKHGYQIIELVERASRGGLMMQVAEMRKRVSA